MTSVAKGVISVAMMIGGTGCAGQMPSIAGGYPVGSIYQGTTVPSVLDRQEIAGASKTGDRSGEACATGILNAAAWGDASLDAAKKEAKISEVHSIELRSFNIFGVYQQGCTEVHGK